MFYPMNFKEAYFSFQFSSFTVQKITIRYKRFAEIYADIGGIWAASVALLAYAFVKSGHVDPKTKKEAYIFKYLPQGMRTAMLKEAKASSGMAPKSAPQVDVATPSNIA